MALTIAKTPEEYLANRLASGFRPSLKHGDSEPPKIESAGQFPIPMKVPRGTGHMNGTHFYPFENMKIGDSFWVSDPEGKRCTAVAVSRFAKKTGWKFLTRCQTEDGRPGSKVKQKYRGTRVWRVE